MRRAFTAMALSLALTIPSVAEEGEAATLKLEERVQSLEDGGCYAADAMSATFATAGAHGGAVVGGALAAWWTGAACSVGAVATAGVSCFATLSLFAGAGILLGAEAGGRMGEATVC